MFFMFFIFFPNQTQQPRTQTHHKKTNLATQELKPRSLGHKWKQEEKTQIQHLRDHQTQRHQIYHKSRSSNSSCSSPNSNTINTEFLANQTHKPN